MNREELASIYQLLKQTPTPSPQWRKRLTAAVLLNVRGQVVPEPLACDLREITASERTLRKAGRP